MQQGSNSTTDLSLGFIGAGKMAQALSKGFIDAGLVKAENIIVSGVRPTNLGLIGRTGVSTTQDNTEVVRQSSVVILAVKPHILPGVLTQVAPLVTPDHLLISIAAGVTLTQMQSMLPSGSRVIRVMPNTPSLVQCGASVYCPGASVTADDEALVSKLFSSVGICERLPETNINAVTGLSGSGPAYVFLTIEALADGGVRQGLPRDVAQRLAAQTVMGAAKMVLETGKHPGELKDGVCSPGGTTIAGIHQLEQGSYRGMLMNAVQAATSRAHELTKS